MLENPYYFSDEARQQRCFWRRVIGLLLTGAAVVGFGILFIVALSGCSSIEERICFMQALGRTEQGHSVVQQICMTPEEFKELQK